jgi:hypothetical protein
MKLLLRSASILLVAIAAFLVYAVIAAVTSDEGARAGVAVAYTAGAIVLAFLAAKLWRSRDAQAGIA